MAGKGYPFEAVNPLISLTPPFLSGGGLGWGDVVM
jgi:hypothetical protein